MFFFSLGDYLTHNGYGMDFGRKKERKRNHLVKDKSNNIVLIVGGSRSLMGPPVVVLQHVSTL